MAEEKKETDKGQENANELTPEQTLANVEKENLKLQGRIEELKKNEDAAEQLAQVIADSDVRTLLQAKHDGEDVQVIVGDDKGSDPDNKKGKDLDEMDRSEFAQHIISESAKAAKGVFDEGIKPVTESLASLTDTNAETKKEVIEKEVTRLEKKHTDFSEYKKAIAVLHEENPNLAIEELYNVAKMRKGVDLTKKVNSASEKPSSTPASPPKKKQRDKEVPATSKGFDQILGEYQGGPDYESQLDKD